MSITLRASACAEHFLRDSQEDLCYVVAQVEVIAEKIPPSSASTTEHHY